MESRLLAVAGLLENIAAALRDAARKNLAAAPAVVRAVLVETIDAWAFTQEDVTDTPDPQQALALAAHLAAYGCYPRGAK